MYKLVGNTIVEVPYGFNRITLVPIENEKDILWKNDWILSKTNKSLKKLLFSLWIPSMYLDSRTKKQNDELLVMLNGGRSSDIIIPTLTAEYGDVKYNLNILNCKGTGRPEILENPQAYVERVSNFSIGNTVISRLEFSCGRPTGGITVKDALKEEVVNEKMMLREGLPHTPHALVLRIPRSIQRRIDKYNSHHIYGYHTGIATNTWIGGDLAQVKRFFTTNIRMMNDSSDLLPDQRDFLEYVVDKKNNKPEWIKPENLAELLGRVDGRYQVFLKNMKMKEKRVDFVGDIYANRTLDGLLTDGENLKFIPNDRNDGMEVDMFADSLTFLENYAELYNKTSRETKRIIKSYEEAKRKEIEHRKPISIPPEK